MMDERPTSEGAGAEDPDGATSRGPPSSSYKKEPSPLDSTVMGRSYHHLLVQILCAGMHQYGGASPYVAASLAWLLSSFCSALRRCRKVQEEESTVMTGILEEEGEEGGPDGENKEAGRGPGMKVKIPRDGEFQFFVMASRLLWQPVQGGGGEEHGKDTAHLSAEAIVKKNKKRGRTGRRDEELLAEAGRLKKGGADGGSDQAWREVEAVLVSKDCESVGRPGPDLTWSTACQAVGRLVQVVHLQRCYHPTEDTHGKQRAFLDELVTQVLEGYDGAGSCTELDGWRRACAAAVFTCEMLEVEHRTIHSHLVRVWELVHKVDRGQTQDDVADNPSWWCPPILPGQLVARLFRAYGELRQVDFVLQACCEAVRSRMVRAVSGKDLNTGLWRVLVRPEVGQAIQTVVNHVPSGQVVGIVVVVTAQLSAALDQEVPATELAHADTIIPAGSHLTCMSEVLLNCLAALHIDITISAAVASAVEVLVRQVVAPTLQPYIKQLKEQLPGSSRQSLPCTGNPEVLFVLLRMYKAAVRLHTFCALMNPEVTFLAGQEIQGPTVPGKAGPVASDFFSAIMTDGVDNVPAEVKDPLENDERGRKKKEKKRKKAALEEMKGVGGSSLHYTPPGGSSIVPLARAAFEVYLMHGSQETPPTTVYGVPCMQWTVLDSVLLRVRLLHERLIRLQCTWMGEEEEEEDRAADTSSGTERLKEEMLQEIKELVQLSLQVFKDPANLQRRGSMLSDLKMQTTWDGVVSSMNQHSFFVAAFGAVCDHLSLLSSYATADDLAGYCHSLVSVMAEGQQKDGSPALATTRAGEQMAPGAQKPVNLFDQVHKMASRVLANDDVMRCVQVRTAVICSILDQLHDSFRMTCGGPSAQINGERSSVEEKGREMLVSGRKRKKSTVEEEDLGGEEKEKKKRKRRKTKEGLVQTCESDLGCSNHMWGHRPLEMLAHLMPALHADSKECPGAKEVWEQTLVWMQRQAQQWQSADKKQHNDHKSWGLIPEHTCPLLQQLALIRSRQEECMSGAQGVVVGLFMMQCTLLLLDRLPHTDYVTSEERSQVPACNGGVAGGEHPPGLRPDDDRSWTCLCHCLTIVNLLDLPGQCTQGPDPLAACNIFINWCCLLMGRLLRDEVLVVDKDRKRESQRASIVALLRQLLSQAVAAGCKLTQGNSTCDLSFVNGLLHSVWDLDGVCSKVESSKKVKGGKKQMKHKRNVQIPGSLEACDVKDVKVTSQHPKSAGWAVHALLLESLATALVRISDGSRPTREEMVDEDKNSMTAARLEEQRGELLLTLAKEVDEKLQLVLAVVAPNSPCVSHSPETKGPLSLSQVAACALLGAGAQILKHERGRPKQWTPYPWVQVLKPRLLEYHCLACSLLSQVLDAAGGAVGPLSGCQGFLILQLGIFLIWSSSWLGHQLGDDKEEGGGGRHVEVLRGLVTVLSQIPLHRSSLLGVQSWIWAAWEDGAESFERAGGMQAEEMLLMGLGTAIRSLMYSSPPGEVFPMYRALTEMLDITSPFQGSSPELSLAAVQAVFLSLEGLTGKQSLRIMGRLSQPLVEGLTHVLTEASCTFWSYWESRGVGSMGRTSKGGRRWEQDIPRQGRRLDVIAVPPLYMQKQNMNPVVDQERGLADTRDGTQGSLDAHGSPLSVARDVQLTCLILIRTLRCLESLLGRDKTFQVPACTVASIMSAMAALFSSPYTSAMSVLAVSLRSPVHFSRLPGRSQAEDVCCLAPIHSACCSLLASILRHRSTEVARMMSLVVNMVRSLLMTLLQWEEAANSWSTPGPDLTSSDPWHQVREGHRVLLNCSLDLVRVYEAMSMHKNTFSKYSMHLLQDYIIFTSIPTASSGMAWSSAPARKKGAPEVSLRATLKRGAYMIFSMLSPFELQHIHRTLSAGSEVVSTTRTGALAQLKEDYEREHKFQGRI